MKHSIKTKLILSYAVIIFLMAGISMSFVSLFSESYILGESRRQLTQYADRIAISLARQTTIPFFFDFEWENLVKELSGKNYSLAIYDADYGLFASSNFDYLNLTTDALAKQLEQRSGKNNSFAVHQNGETYVVCSRTIKYTTGEIYATIAVLMQVDKYNIDNLLTLLFLVSVLVAAFIAVISGFIFSRQLTTNLKKLQKRADMLANRQFDDSVKVTSNDEVGDLARSIDEMAHSIEEYDRSQKVFLQNASHELRTPLMSIRGYIEGLRDGVFTENKEEIYNSVLSQTERLEKLVEDVMYLSKIETTKDIIVLKPVSTIEIVDEAIERVEGIAAANDIELLKGDIVIMNIKGDGDHLATVFTNIFSNCLRFAKKRIIVEGVPVEKGVVFTITDDGPGINNEDLPYIFERFYKGKKGKHGLGLAIAKAIVLSHKGTIEAYNRRDGVSGAVFEIFLPV